jgi:hypothetical protein
MLMCGGRSFRISSYICIHAKSWKTQGRKAHWTTTETSKETARKIRANIWDSRKARIVKLFSHSCQLLKWKKGKHNFLYQERHTEIFLQERHFRKTIKFVNIWTAFWVRKAENIFLGCCYKRKFSQRWQLQQLSFFCTMSSFKLISLRNSLCFANIKRDLLLEINCLKGKNLIRWVA